MCGILGFTASNEIEKSKVSKILADLFLLSESRGKEASGIAVRTEDSIHVLKVASPASALIRSESYKRLLANHPRSAIGHARLVTSGMAEAHGNNQPVIKDGIVTVHNGIIVNHDSLWKKFPSLRREYEVDTEIINALTRHFIVSGLGPTGALARVYEHIIGEASIALMLEDFESLFLATNTGSIYILEGPDWAVFASERRIVDEIRGHVGGGTSHIVHLEAGSGCIINRLGSVSIFPLASAEARPEPPVLRAAIHDVVIPSSQIAARSRMTRMGNGRYSVDTRNLISQLQRCSRCILPETMPFIEFDQWGVCNFCRYYSPSRVLGADEFMRTLHPSRNIDGYDCILPFSGGRDSSYALHLLVKELGLRPLAFSYDWGMITDLGRRNQARLCGALGVEHIWLSADIARKRRNIRRNVIAWLRRPALGTIPLFMAGDKQYFYYANALRRTTGISRIVYGENLLEKTDFKSGFAGVPPKFGISHAYDLGMQNKLRLVSHYVSEYIRNPRLLNSSIIDTAFAFLSSYLIPHDYLHVFKYLDWDEKEIERLLPSQYDWELAPDTKSTWRIGDGTAPFYNYIYYVVAGFTENDTFRSNQIREGKITRREALALADRDNAPRWESLQWYFDTIGIDGSEALKRIDAIPKLYQPAR